MYRDKTHVLFPSCRRSEVRTRDPDVNVPGLGRTLCSGPTQGRLDETEQV